jgi:uncharacterized protein (TIGR00290 family)
LRDKLLVSWSGGKDSAMALHEVLTTGAYEVTALLTTITEEYDRISLHGVRRGLVQRQAESIGIPIEEVFIPLNISNEEYGSKMEDILLRYKDRGVLSVMFGDLFLEDVRTYRESNLRKVGMKGIFPLWQRDNATLVKEFIDLRFKAVITCVDSRVLDKRFAGRILDRNLLNEFPSHVDVSGENGEYHTFVFAGPLYRDAVRFSIGNIVSRNGFHYCDLMPQ